MKKVLLGLLALSSFTMAEGKLFDFKNAKPFSGKVNVEGTLILPIDGTGKEAFVRTLYGDVVLNSRIYDFGLVGGKLTKGGIIRTASNIGQIYNVEDNPDYFKVGLDFKQYGTTSIRFDDFSIVNFIYENKAKIYDLGIEGGLKLELNSGLPIETKLKLDYDLIDGLNVYTEGVLKIELYDTNLNGKTHAKVTGEYLFGAKYDKYNIENDLKVKYDNDRGNFDGSPYTHKVNIKNKFGYKIGPDILGVENLTVKPKLDVDFLINNVDSEGNLLTGGATPGVEVNYELIKGLNFYGKANVNIDAGKTGLSIASTKDKFTITPEVKVGLNYSF